MRNNDQMLHFYDQRNKHVQKETFEHSFAFSYNAEFGKQCSDAISVIIVSLVTEILQF